MKTGISLKVDRSVKDEARRVAQGAGLTLSALINAYLRKVAATRRIELYAPEEMSPKLEKLVGEVEAELAAGQASKEFGTPEALVRDLKR